MVFGLTANLRRRHAVCLQAALLAQRDSRSPGIVVALTAAFNLVADIALIVGAGLGLTGAAIATVATQYLSLAALAWVCSQPGRLSPDFASLLRTRPAPPAPRAAADEARPAAAVPPGGTQVAGFAAAASEIGAAEAAVAAGVEQRGAGGGAAEKSGGGGGTLAIVYAAKLICYFLVQVRGVRNTGCWCELCSWMCFPGDPPRRHALSITQSCPEPMNRWLVAIC